MEAENKTMDEHVAFMMKSSTYMDLIHKRLSPPKAPDSKIMIGLWDFKQQVQRLDEEVRQSLSEQVKSKGKVRQRTQIENLLKAIRGLSLEAKDDLFGFVSFNDEQQLQDRKLLETLDILVSEIIDQEEGLRKLEFPSIDPRTQRGPFWILMNFFTHTLETAAEAALRSDVCKHHVRRGRPDGNPGVSGKRNRYCATKAIDLFLQMGFLEISISADSPLWKWLDLLQEITGVKLELAKREQLIRTVTGATAALREQYVKSRLEEMDIS